MGFGLDAYMCLGTKDTGQAHAWVMTRHHGGKIVFWESLTGQRCDLIGTPCPQYRTLACVFSNKTFFANIQPSGLISSCDFDVTNKAKWKAMDPAVIHALCGPDIQPALPIPPSLQQSSVNSVSASRKLEQELRAAIQDYRQGIGFTVQWDKTLSHILSPCLAANENHAKTGQAVNADELHEPIYQYLPRKMSLESVTTCINHFQVSQAITDIQSLQEFHAIIDCNKERVMFALRVHIYPYPDDVCAAWVILAAVYPDDKPTRQWNIVKLLNN
jgi:centrosomal protein CEP76